MGSICAKSSTEVQTLQSRRPSIFTSKKDLQFRAGQFVQENRDTFESVYTLDKSPIGTGAFAEVWLCTHKRTKDVRAVKVFDKSTLTAGEIKSRSVFVEVEILKTLDHPNILKVYEYFEDDLKYYIVMEYCEGGDLFDRIEAEGTFTERYASKIMRLIFKNHRFQHRYQENR